MATFAELRDRLSPDVHKRGKQFERVCKWLLETDPRYANRLSKVWLWDDWPDRWGPDCGIDLVAEDLDGKTWAIQAKCYDANYSVTKADVDSFLSESVHKLIDHRLLIATTNGVGKNARRVIRQQNEVVPVSQLLLADLEAAPVVWPTSPDRPTGGKARKPFTPCPNRCTSDLILSSGAVSRPRLASIDRRVPSEDAHELDSVVLFPDEPMLPQTQLNSDGIRGPLAPLDCSGDVRVDPPSLFGSLAPTASATNRNTSRIGSV